MDDPPQVAAGVAGASRPAGAGRTRARRLVAVGLLVGSLSSCGTELPLKIGVAGFQVDDEGHLEIRMVLCGGELDSVRLVDLDSSVEPRDLYDSGRWERVGASGPGVLVLDLADPGPDWRTLQEPDLDAGPTIDRQVDAIGPSDDEIGSAAA